MSHTAAKQCLSFGEHAPDSGCRESHCPHSMVLCRVVGCIKRASRLLGIVKREEHANEAQSVGQPSVRCELLLHFGLWVQTWIIEVYESCTFEQLYV